MTRRLISLTIPVIILFVLGTSGAARQSSRKNSLPPGNWSLAYGPTQTRGKIVDLFSVSSDAAKGLAVTEVSLENRSDQDIAAVKIGWTLYERSNRSKTLLSGETPQFLAVALAPGEKRVVNYPVVSFARIHGPLVRAGKLEGDFRIELWVTEVQFDSDNPDAQNSSSFRLQKVAARTGPTFKFLRVPTRPAPQKDDSFGCPHRECKWSNQHQCYRCELTENSTCAWESCSSCASGRCSGGLLD